MAMMRDTAENSYTVYGIAGAGSLIAEYILEETGIAYRRVFLDRAGRDEPGFREISPTGRVPVLVCPDGVTIFESLAITIHLLENHDTGLIAAAGTAERARCWQWLCYLATTLYPAKLQLHYPERYGPVRESALAASLHVSQCYGYLEKALNPWLAGPRLSAADLYLAMLAEWHPQRPVLLEAHPKLAQMLAEVLARPAIDRVMTAQLK